MVCKKHKTFCTTLNCIEHFLLVVSRITRCISISAFVSLVGIPIWRTNSTIGLKICPITAAIQKYQSTIKKKKKKNDKIVLSAKSKLISIEVLISKALIDLFASHDEFVLINNLLKEYNKMKKEMKNLKNQSSFRLSLCSSRS